MMSKLTHNQVLEQLVRRLSKKYEVTARNVLYGPKGHIFGVKYGPIEPVAGEVDFVAFRHTSQGITLNLYEIKTNLTQYEHAVEQLNRAKNYFSSVNTLPDYFKGVVLQWLGKPNYNLRINLLYINPMDGVKRVGRFHYNGRDYVAEQGRKGREDDLHETSQRSDAASLMQHGKK